jgi:hypothetical protein
MSESDSLTTPVLVGVEETEEAEEAEAFETIIIFLLSAIDSELVYLLI